MLTPALVAALALHWDFDTPGATIDLTRATVVARGDAAAQAELTAVRVLVEEVEKRTGLRWTVRPAAPAQGPVIEVAVGPREGAPESFRARAAGLKREGYLLVAEPGERPIVRVVGVDARGALFGVGKLLRMLRLASGRATFPAAIDIVSAPAYPIRGHQLGYRDRANSWDAWDEGQFDQYVRELALFGSNCVENIPFQDANPGPLMRLPRPVMNVRLSEICARYDQDYWLWTPADFDLNDQARRAQALREHEELYLACPRLDNIFVPGGDPGENPPELVLPFLQDLAERLQRHHPRAKVWLSLQGFRGERAAAVYRYLDEKQPDWFGGIVCGPSSPPIEATRRRLSRKYPIRHYPDITHNVRAQYPVPWWDPAFGFTLGREAINPRPVQYAEVHNAFAPFTAGFLSYSDGVHDDVNKVVWSARAWDPDVPVRDVLVEYARVFFGDDVAERSADGILALERNWVGPLRTNGGVEATLQLWDALAAQAPDLAGNWRWQMCQLRAAYDAYLRARLFHESALEDEANAKLSEAPLHGANAAIDEALAVLNRATTDPARPDLRGRVERHCEALFRSIGLQTSQERHKASGPERGCVLDFIDHPLNNRWWLEDQLAAVRQLPSERERLDRLETLRAWERPGPGSFYDKVGDIGMSPHVVRGDVTTLGSLTTRVPTPEVLWWERGKSRQRPAWMLVMNWPLAMRYTGLDPEGDYIIRTTGNGQCLLSINGEKVAPTLDNNGIGEFKEFPVPRHLLKDGALVLTFERPVETVNWRYQSRLSELWLLKR